MIVPDTSPLGITLSVLSLLAGLVLTFSGYRLARSLAMLAGFLAGVVIGLPIGAGIAGPVGALVAALVLGIALALLFKFAFRFAGAIVGALAGVALGTNLAWPIWGLVAAAVVGGLAGLFLNKIAIVACTAIVGASLAVKSAVELFYAFSDYVLTMETLSILVSTVVLAAAGILSQMRSLRGEDEVATIRESAS